MPRLILALLPLTLLPLALLPWPQEALGAAPDTPALPDMVTIPGGTLLREDGSQISLRSFALARTEITFDQWQACVDAGACRGGQDDHGWGRGNRPVINVSHDDATLYARWLSEASGRTCRLPEEDEWEWAARAGSPQRPWWWGNTPEGRVNCRGCGTEWSGKKTAPAGALPANPYGLHEMEGNVWEWTATCWSPTRTAATTEATLRAETPCRKRVAKGGAWYYIQQQAWPSARVGQPPDLWSYTVGFRVACDLP